MGKPSPLSTFHQSNGAQFLERDGWLLPARFGNSAAEYAAVRSAVGLLDLSYHGLFQVTGPDRLSFLQGMLSNDLRALTPYTGQYATLLTQQGKVIADVRVLCAMNSFYLDFLENLKEKILSHLNRYLVADEVEIADRCNEYGTLSIQGPQSEALLRELAGQAELPAHSLQHTMVNIDSTAICAVHASHTGETGFDLIVPIPNLPNVAQKLTETGKQFSAAWVGEDAQNILRVEAGIPRYGVDFTEDNLLLEVGLDHAVSFTKGCYLGQEVVERIRSRGHVNKKLVGLSLEGQESARPEDVILSADKPIGTITSSVHSPALGRPIALGYVHRDYWKLDTRLIVKHDGISLDARVTDLPFVPARLGSVSSS
ncbi:MAG TPA: aminomethyltransferase family protein [Candidatus Binatia bacterium]|nr:aminomethyltransferase family protein [Candidatus Binatia bacterium]